MTDDLIEWAWLVEFPESGDLYQAGKRVGPATPVRWYCGKPAGEGRVWTHTSDPNEAIRFARKQDAEAMIRVLDSNDYGPTKATATEHQWGTGYEAAARIRELEARVEELEGGLRPLRQLVEDFSGWPDSTMLQLVLWTADEDVADEEIEPGALRDPAIPLRLLRALLTKDQPHAD